MRERSAIAITGLACRLPGADGPRALWRLLAEGRSAIGEVPAGRWDEQRLRDAEELAPGIRRGGFLEQVDGFDHSFFGISPREAMAMDPQQRLMLELCWESLEDAGIVPGALQGSAGGVFAGAISGDYGDLLSEARAGPPPRHAATGVQRSMIANRISYALGLRGPSMTVDTGQSASLVAVHLACESLRKGESEMALAGGVHLNLSTAGMLLAASFGGLSPDGCCRALDARADGYVRGEGGAVVVLKRLSDALAAGDPIYCVIRSSAVNNDGGGDGLTAPDRSAQEEVLRLACRRAGIRRSDVQYVELHGTGTVLGDRVEACALGGALGRGRPSERPLAVGSVKTNLGHLQGAAGVVGLLKVALCIAHRELPASLNFERPHPEVPLAQLGLSVQCDLAEWPDGARPLLAGVSSFGLGGTNCHLIVGESPPTHGPPLGAGLAGGLQTPVELPLGEVPPAWVLSGRSDVALRAQARRLAEWARTEPECAASAVAHALVRDRTPFEHRAVVGGGDRDELLDGLEALAGGRPAPRLTHGVVSQPGQRPVFVFAGQGSQWNGMALELLDQSTPFARSMSDCAGALAPHVDWRLEDVLRGVPGAPGLDRVDVVQPALFAVMVSLAALWRECGVQPAAVVGHSQGEVAAAYVAGALSLEDAATIVALRSKMLVKHLLGRGAMAWVGLPVEKVRSLCAPWQERISVAAVNAPASVVVSGEIQALEGLLEQCRASSVRVRAIPAGVGAGHSPQVELLRPELLDALARLKPRQGDIPLYSTVSAAPVEHRQLDAQHWYSNARKPVLFQQAICALLGDGHRAFLEVSPHPVLTTALQDIVDAWVGETGAGPEESSVFIGSSLKRGEGGPDRLLRSLSDVWASGMETDWEAVLGPIPSRIPRLPTYPFQRQRYWLEPAAHDPGAGARAHPTGTSHLANVTDPPGGDRPPGAAHPADAESLGERLKGLPTHRQRHELRTLVLAHVSALLGYASPDRLPPRRTFKELGFDSPTGLELRKRLSSELGLALPATLAFDSPTPEALVEQLLDRLRGGIELPRLPPRLREQEEDESEPVAIVAMACRYPGGVRSPQELWELVAEEREAIGEFPVNRGWSLRTLYHPDPEHAGTTYLPCGGFLYDADEFDPSPFGISPREALAMDPQQRLLLEVSWEGFERAGIPLERLRGSDTGVFMGVIYDDYGGRLNGVAPPDLEAHLGIGSAGSVASGRIAYTFGLEGPAVTLDTACSSSLVALHLACASLRARECELALAGGVTVLATPQAFVEFSRQGALAADGRVKSYSEAANGTVWSEGVGVLVLERLGDARRLGHPVLGLVRGSAVNQDGASNGLTAPSGRAQRRVIERALAGAGLSAGDVDAVEGHGTGTALGDPIEVQALLDTYGQGRERGAPLWLGSIKSNLGHTQAAAGVAGVIKMVMAMRHGVLPRTLHCEQPSSHVDWSAGAVSLLDERRPWPAHAISRRAGISSFGVSGTNAHLIVEEPPRADTETRDSPMAELPLGEVGAWALSAHDEPALRSRAEGLADRLSGARGLDGGEIGRALARQPLLGRRAVVLGSSEEELASTLRSVAHMDVARRGAAVEGSAIEGGLTAFVFPGQGAQWQGMGVELLDTSPVFAQEIRSCERALAPHVEWSLQEVLRGGSESPGLDRVDVVQPTLFAIMMSLAALWRSCGVRPEAVVGHSQGEIAAACVAGALSLEDAAQVVAVRSRALRELANRGGMVSVALGAEQLKPLLDPLCDGVSVAAVNGPGATVVSGELPALERLLAACQERGIRARRIPVDYAAHSAQVQDVRAELIAGCEGIAPLSGDLPFYSAVTGGLLDGGQLDAGYWYRNLRHTVRFEQATGALLADGASRFLEMSPHPVLTAAVQETAEQSGAGRIAAIGSLRRQEGGCERMLRSLAQAWVGGVGVDWTLVLGPPSAVPPELPTYPFQRKPYWLQAPGDVAAPGDTGSSGDAGLSGEAATSGYVALGDEGSIRAPRPAIPPALVAPNGDAPLGGAGSSQLLSGLDEQDRGAVLLGLVCAHAAGVLGHSSPSAIEPERTFKEHGFDSVLGVELRNRLADVLDVRLPATLVFDHPTPRALAAHLLDRSGGGGVEEVGEQLAAPDPGEPLAIVGIGCRFPGGAWSAQKLWELVCDGRDAIGPFPADRGWGAPELLAPAAQESRQWCGEAGFLHDATSFDAAFFGISPREALAMDPQQRLLLEVCWEAIEDARLDPLALRGSRTGVFAGVSSQEYLHPGQALPAELQGYRVTGGLTSVVSGRIAYSFGLQGPALTIDTACSSSLVATHLACQALRAGECSLALAGGVTVLVTPQVFEEFSHQNGLAGDGRCKAFSERADGTSFSEGAGVLVLERLSDALRKGHEVLALIRGSAVNQDGASNGLTAPNGPSQQRVIAQALANARLSGAEVDAVEGHGTGTTLGDPIEAQAIIATYGQQRLPDRPLWLGSIKSNIGHTAAAAGVAGVAKMVMALRRELLPRTLHVDEPSSEVDWSEGEVSLLVEEVPWRRNGHTRRAGVSSFGVSGTNAHLILEEAPPLQDTPRRARDARSGAICEGGTVPWVLSGRDREALGRQARRLADHLRARGEPVSLDVGCSLARRVGLEHRAVVLGRDRDELLEGLETLAGGELAARVVSGVGLAPPRVAMLFPGQGSQWSGMGSALIDRSPVFAEAIRACAEALAPYVDWSLEDVLRGHPGAPSLDRVDVVQPALFAMMVSLAALWRSCGVVPDAVGGHSQGEIAAACVAGGLSLEDGARVIALRGRALARLETGGGMASLALGAEDAIGRLEQWGGRIALAAVNGPSSVVVSGERDLLEELLERCRAEGVRARSIPVDYAAHSPQVEQIREELLEGCAGIVPRPSAIPFYSAVTGEQIDTEQLDGEYWYRNLREQVRLDALTRALLRDKHRVLVEASPHPVLVPALRETMDSELGEDGALAIGSLRRNEGPERWLRSLGEAWVGGVEVDWTGLFAELGAQPVDLPPYAFRRDRYWLQVGGGGDVAATGLEPLEHPLLAGSLEPAGGGDALFTGSISIEAHPWLADHVVMGLALLPASAFLELALVAGAQLGCESLDELALEAPLLLEERCSRQLQVAVGEPDWEGRRAVQISSRPAPGSGLAPSSGQGWGAREWTRHASGTLAVAPPPPQYHASDSPHARRLADLAGAWPPPAAQPLTVEGLYERLRERGIEYGPHFQGLSAAWSRGEEIFAEVSLPETPHARAGHFRLHPALLDAAFHPALSHPALNEPGRESGGDGLRDGAAATSAAGALLPFSFAGVGLAALGARSLRVALCVDGERRLSVTLADENGQPAGSIDSLATRPMSEEQLRSIRNPAHSSLFSVSWTPLSSEPVVRAARPGALAVLGDGSAAAGLRDAGAPAQVHPDLPALLDALAGGAPAPETVLLDCCEPTGAPSVRDLPERSRLLAVRALAAAQGLLSQERLDDSRVVVLTSDVQRLGAVHPLGERSGVPSPAGAGVWGLVRSAQSELPGRFLLVDVDGEPSSWQALSAAAEAAWQGGESQLALRAGAAFVPRLVPLAEGRRTASAPPLEGAVFQPGRSVLVTGGTGGLGAVLARHLAREHGVRSIVLASRRGPEAVGAAQLQEELASEGVGVRLAACDVTDRAQLQRLLESLPPEHPLGAVVHAAGTTDDDLLQALSAEQLERVLAPKLDAAWHLHELTRELDLSAFVLFSSVAATLGGPGMGNYAAANACLDALAEHRRALGLPAVSIAWGLWSGADGMGDRLSDADLERYARGGVGTFAVEEGLKLFDLACDAGHPFVVAARLDPSALRSRASSGALPALLRELAPAPAPRPQASAPKLAERLAALRGDARRLALLEIVQREVAGVLDHPSPRSIDSQSTFKQLGFDSMTALELRNRLQAIGGLRLPATLVFDYPSIAALSDHLLARLPHPDGVPPDGEELPEVEEWGAVLPSATREQVGHPDDTASPLESLGLEALVERALGGSLAKRERVR